MTKKKAAEYLGVTTHVLKHMIKNKKVKVDLLNKIIPEELEAVKKDLEERRSLSKPVWIQRNEF